MLEQQQRGHCGQGASKEQARSEQPQVPEGTASPQKDLRFSVHRSEMLKRVCKGKLAMALRTDRKRMWAEAK